jgi:hypothetical protein
MFSAKLELTPGKIYGRIALHNFPPRDHRGVENGTEKNANPTPSSEQPWRVRPEGGPA